MAMTQRAVAYFRTSSATNVGKDKDSEQRQRDSCQAYASQHDLVIIQEFYDAEVKGKDSIGNRPNFLEMLSYCEKNQIKIILFENASRFSRDLVVQELAYQELSSKGYKLINSENPESFMDNSPSSKAMRQMWGVFAEYQKDELVAKLKGARERKKALNQQMGLLTLKGSGKCEGRKSYLESQPELIQLTKNLADLLSASGNNCSLREISKQLAAHGILTAKGKSFSHSQVKRLLSAS